MNKQNVKTFKLSNGLTILFYPMHNLPILNVNLWVNVGSVNEPLSINGISHFLEHMLFKDTKKYPNNLLTKKIESIGGHMNAATSVDYTHYYATIHKDFKEQAFDVLGDMAFHLDINEKNLDLERGVIIEEIQRCNDNPWNVLWTELYANFFDEHNYANPIIGNKTNIKKISRNDLYAYYDHFYSPKNLTLVVAGDIKAKELLNLSTKYFDFGVQKNGHKKDKCLYKKDIKTHKSKLTAKKYFKKDMPTISQTYFSYAYQAPTIKQNGFTEMTLISSMLGQGISSVLNKRLKEDEHLVWLVGDDFSEHKYAGIFIIYGLCDRKNLDKIDKILQEELANLENTLTQADLDKIKRIFKLQHELSHETCSDITDSLGYYSVFSSWEDVFNKKEAILNTSLQDIKSYLKYFKSDKFIRQVVTNGK